MECCNRPDIELMGEEGYECLNCGYVHGHRRPVWCMRAKFAGGMPYQWNDRSLHVPRPYGDGPRTVGHSYGLALKGAAKYRARYAGPPHQSWGAYHVEKTYGIGYTARESAARRLYAESLAQVESGSTEADETARFNATFERLVRMLTDTPPVSGTSRITNEWRGQSLTWSSDGQRDWQTTRTHISATTREE